jgi:hypothetical protein
MPKKSRRTRAKFKNNQQSGIAENRIPTPMNAAPVTQVVRSVSGSSVALRANRHVHVVPELIRISIISGILFVIIIILTFVLG